MKRYFSRGIIEFGNFIEKLVFFLCSLTSRYLKNSEECNKEIPLFEQKWFSEGLQYYGRQNG